MCVYTLCQGLYIYANRRLVVRRRARRCACCCLRVKLLLLTRIWDSCVCIHCVKDYIYMQIGASSCAVAHGALSFIVCISDLVCDTRTLCERVVSWWSLVLLSGIWVFTFRGSLACTTCVGSRARSLTPRPGGNDCGKGPSVYWRGKNQIRSCATRMSFRQT
jgi:hypothetical protein